MNTAVRNMILKSIDLVKYTECPKCGVSWREIEDSLHDGDENRMAAEIIIRTCDCCWVRFGVNS